MARQSVVYATRGPATFRNVRYDSDGTLVFVMRENEVKDVDLDLTAFVDTGETITTATSDASFISDLVVTSPLISLSVTASRTWAEGTIRINLSTGERMEQMIRVETLPPAKQYRYVH
jgi:hypothetical protein